MKYDLTLTNPMTRIGRLPVPLFFFFFDCLTMSCRSSKRIKSSSEKRWTLVLFGSVVVALMSRRALQLQASSVQTFPEPDFPL